ncbi:MAG: alanine racemase [Clostridia bacterium]|nr:alanine racemase [Clostridia bacterium]
MQNILIEVNLSHIRQNAAWFLSGTNAKLCAVVKANAYGHGALQIAEALRPYASSYAVSLVDEGVALRLGGIEGDILVLTPPVDRYDVERANAYDLILTVPDADRAALCKDARVHLALNVGMNRYGFDQRETLPPLRVEGIYAHFTDALPHEEQYADFMRLSEAWKKDYPNAKLHLSATKGFLHDRRYHLDMVRIGIGLYGYGAPALKPAMKVYALSVQSRRYERGGFGYFAGKKTPYVTTLRAGYGDGFFRNNRYCMDAIVKEGKFPNGMIVPLMENAEEEAARNSTIPYEILTAFGKRGTYVYKI